MILRRIWLEPPLAIARLGGSPFPLDAFYWGPNDYSADGSGRTTILPAPSLFFQPNGALRVETPPTIAFKDEAGFRPVCPFFELWGEWDDGAETLERPVTDQDLKPSEMCWTINAANLKPFNLTRDRATRIDASVILPGGCFDETVIEGRSPDDAEEPLVPPGRFIPLGMVRLARPSTVLPQYRLRIIPGRGHFYGPTNLKERWPVDIPDERLFLNPSSAWPKWKATYKDVRSSPAGQYVQDDDKISLGLVDDTCDGVVTCSVEGSCLTASARFVVGPPDFNPERRPVVSIADGLKDRVERDDVDMREGAPKAEVLTEEVIDLFERIVENAAHMNVDMIVDRFRRSDPEVAEFHHDSYHDEDALPRLPATPGDPLPLSALALRRHRRLATREVLIAFVLRNPTMVDMFVRDPATRRRVMTREMPAAMIGSDGAPLHLTRRQTNRLRQFVDLVIATDGRLD